MKKFFLICTIVLSSIIIQAQTTIVVPNVKISETERVIDKYLDKAGSVVGSVISKVTPIAKEAFVVYATKYHIQGFINISIALCLLILLSIITIFMFKRSTHYEKKKDEDSESAYGIGGCFGILFILITFIVICLHISDWITMINVPGYWVIQCILGK